MNFPLFIDLKDKKVLIVGAGAIAARRATVLVEFGAKVTVVAPEEGSGVQVNHAAELKSFTDVGDSVLGYKAHMGAGSITSNVKSDKKLVVVHGDGFDIETGMKKFGAMLGDNVEVGCNSVLNPGTVIGRESNVYPLSSVRGVVPERSIFKKQGDVVAKR